MGKWILYIIGMIIFLISCEQRDEVAVQLLIKERVTANITSFKNRKIQECYKEAMEEAILVADSIVIAQALAAKDTSQLIRPIKPAKPSVIIPKDDKPIEPLFKKNE